MREPPPYDPLRTPPRVTLANFYPFRAGEVAGPHWSASDLFLPATHGRGEIQVGPRRFELLQGQILHVPWASPIRYQAERHDPFVLIGVHLSYVAWTEPPIAPIHSSRKVDMARTAMEPPPCAQPFSEPFLLTPPPGSRLLDLGIAIARAYELGRVGAPARDREARLRALALEFIVELRACRQGELSSVRHPQAGVVRELASWMELTLGRPIRRAEIAERAGMSESALAAAFRAVTGRAPIDYLIDLRLARARTLLSSSRQRVGEVAARVGIPDAYYFSKLFKRRTGLSPLQYRQQRRL